MLQLKVYSASHLKEELNAAKREFLQGNVVVKKSSKVFLPKLVERFSREASISIDDLLGWVMESVDKKLHDSIQKCLEHKSNKKPSQIIEWRPYSSRFRYMFSKVLIDKPWWVWHHKLWRGSLNGPGPKLVSGSKEVNHRCLKKFLVHCNIMWSLLFLR